MGEGHRTLAYLGKGGVFGLRELVLSQFQARPCPLESSLRAMGHVDVLMIPAEIVQRHVLSRRSPDAWRRFVESSGSTAVSPRPSDGTLRSGSVDAGLLEFLGERHLINGTQTMVIDLDRCTRCDECVRACAATHDNNPRFVRHGPRHDNLMIAHACMHCVDPVCMIGCPTGAIARDERSGVIRIHDSTCIGCGTCANSCPYQNIQMVEIHSAAGDRVIDAQTHDPIRKATKCDLCSDLRGGPACQRACPHDALVRMNTGDIGALGAWLS
jgi:Fe-S-cluster-containing dehydrogenase component